MRYSFMDTFLVILFSLTLSYLANASDSNPCPSSPPPQTKNAVSHVKAPYESPVPAACVKPFKAFIKSVGSSKLMSMLLSLTIFSKIHANDHLYLLPAPGASRSETSASTFESGDNKNDSGGETASDGGQDSSCKFVVLKKADFDAYSDKHLVKKAARYNFYLGLGGVTMVPITGMLGALALSGLLPDLYGSTPKPAQMLIPLAILAGSFYGFKKIWVGGSYYGYVEDFRHLAKENRWKVIQGPSERTIIQIVEAEKRKQKDL